MKRLILLSAAVCAFAIPHLAEAKKRAPAPTAAAAKKDAKEKKEAPPKDAKPKATK